MEHEKPLELQLSALRSATKQQIVYFEHRTSNIEHRNGESGDAFF